MPFLATRVIARVVSSSSRGSTAAGLAGFLLAAGLTLVRGGIPAPHVHDEFSYLLQADTFAHGRLANPPHPMWQYFESFHVLQQPVYASKYPPAQGLMLAAGQILTGRPIVGVWLGFGLMCAALTWMLYAWVRPRWALGGGFFAALYLTGYQAGTGSWASSYWGGALAALGGALLYGGLRRVMTRPRVLPAVLMALGLGILANSRPYEGLLAALPAGLCFLAWLWSIRREVFSGRILRVVGAVGGTLGGIGLLMGLYNARITGSPWKMPYFAYESQYQSAPLFLWSKPRAMEYRHAVMRQFYQEQPQAPRGVGEAGTRVFGKVLDYTHFFAPAFMWVLLLLIPVTLYDRRLWLPAAAIGLVGLGLVTENYGFGHYAAPIVGPLVILYVAAARRLALLRTGRARTGRQVLRVVLALIAVSAAAYPAYRVIAGRRSGPEWSVQRREMEDRLERSGGKHLIMVSYGPKHSPAQEWVYNKADIDASPVLWARSMGPDADSPLQTYYRDRTAWRLEVFNDDGPFQLQPVASVGGR